MTRLNRYVSRTVLVATLVALLGLLLLDTFFALLAELDELGEGSYHLATAFHYLGLSLPRRLYDLCPFALLLGGLLGLGALASSNELLIMQGVGLSRARLVVMALQVGLILGLAALLLGEFVVPTTDRLAERLRAGALDKPTLIRAGQGFWARNGSDIVNVQAVLPGARLAQIQIYRVDERGELQSLLLAASADYLSENGRWRLEQISIRRLHLDRIVTESQAAADLDLGIRPETIEILASDPFSLSLRALLTYIDYLEANDLDAGIYRLALWTKLLAPLTNLSMLFIAMPFAFGSRRSAGMGQRLVIGIGLGLLLFLGYRMLGNVILLYGLPPLVGAGLPPLLLFGIGAYALERER
jgi:lipopolysaccharide export system permease protein